jgi:biotin synthase
MPLREMTTDLIQEAVERILSGGAVTEEEACALLEVEGERRIRDLVEGARRVTERFHRGRADLCAIVSGKTGACPEDCSFCSQSSRYETDAPIHALLSEEEILSAARRAKATGAKRFCIVSQGTAPYGEDFPRILRMVRRIRGEVGIEADCALGSLTREQAAALKEAGVTTYNHNIETAPSFFGRIITTHGFEDRVRTVKILKEVGIRTCCGGILNMGESRRQRVEFAFALKALDVDIVPINFLNPRPGTPLGDRLLMDPWEAIKTVAVFRLILPGKVFKLAGGREVNLGELQSLAILAGGNGAIIGGYLTTQGGDPAADRTLFQSLGFQV